MQPPSLRSFSSLFELHSRAGIKRWSEETHAHRAHRARKPRTDTWRIPGELSVCLESLFSRATSRGTLSAIPCSPSSRILRILPVERKTLDRSEAERSRVVAIKVSRYFLRIAEFLDKFLRTILTRPRQRPTTRGCFAVSRDRTAFASRRRNDDETGRKNESIAVTWCAIVNYR